MPVGGREMTEGTIAAEVGLVDRTVSFTKGCFTGQELVARLDARGSKVARRLCGVVAGTLDPGVTVPRSGPRCWTADGPTRSVALLGGLVSRARRPWWPWPPSTDGWTPPEPVVVRWQTGRDRLAAAEARPLPLVA